jgi:hypothetical protein
MMSEVTIKIDSDYALVIFEFLAELSDGNRDITGILDVERAALDRLESILEGVLLQPFEENYIELVADARSRIQSTGIN